MDSTSHRRDTLLRLGPAWALAAALSSVAGCAQFNLRGDGFADSFEKSSGYKRPVEKSAIPFGVSAKAREIERDFGVE